MTGAFVREVAEFSSLRMEWKQEREDRNEVGITYIRKIHRGKKSEVRERGRIEKKNV